MGQGVPIAPLVQDLSEHYLHRTVLDKTLLTDNYDFALQWTPDEGQGGSAIFKAAEEEQLGLKLESQPRDSRHRSCREAFGELAAGHKLGPSDGTGRRARLRMWEIASVYASFQRLTLDNVRQNWGVFEPFGES